MTGVNRLSRALVAAATAVDTSADPAEFYQYMWWVGPPPAGGGRAPLYAVGKYGELVGVFPEQDVVVVRLGTTDGGVDWRALLRDVADRVAAEE
jgi:CubicO group peptidase (beta-lactamase class C family)